MAANPGEGSKLSTLSLFSRTQEMETGNKESCGSFTTYAL